MKAEVVIFPSSFSNASKYFVGAKLQKKQRCLSEMCDSQPLKNFHRVEKQK